jgi:SAM-dependent methyltransferase
MIDNSGVDLNETTRLELLNDMEDFHKELRPKNKIPCKDTNRVKILEKQWYESLPNPDYSVYSHENYFIDVFMCWAMYSRVYIKKLSKIDIFNDIDTIVDLGCGPGFTTDALSKVIDAKRVVGTNLKNTWQWNHAKNIGIEIVTDIKEVDTRIDLIVAFEYFEHIEDPIQHLKEILSCSPRFLVVRNGFNGHAIGHFNEYPVDTTNELFFNMMISTKKMNRLFSQTMRDHGYESTKYFYNEDPQVFHKIK